MTTSFWRWALLGVILLSAFAVRILGIGYGLPYVFYPDEAVIVNHAVAFGTGDLNPRYFNYPSLYMYVLFVIYGITYVAGLATGVFESQSDFAQLFFTDATPFYLPGRLIAMACGVASVWMVYRTGARLRSAWAGLAGAALLAFSVHHVMFSHWIKIEVPSAFLASVSLWFSLAASTSGRMRHYLLAGGFAGLAASVMYPAGFVIVALPVAHLFGRLERGRTGEAVLDRRLIAAAAVCGLAFVLTTPFAVLDWRTFVSDLTNIGSMYSSGRIWARSPIYPFTSLPQSMGVGVGVTVLLALVLAVVGRRRGDLVVAAYPLFVGLFFTMFSTKELHHMIIAFPALCVLGGVLLEDGARALLRERRWAPVALGAAVVAIVSVSALEAFSHAYRLALPDTRVLAREWVEANVPHGSVVVMDAGKYYLESFGPPIPVSGSTIRAMLARSEGLRDDELETRIGSRRAGYAREAEYFRQMLAVLGDRSGYAVVRITHDEGSAEADVQTLDDYVSGGATHAIVSSRAWDLYSPDGEQALSYPDKTLRYRSFYESLERRATLLREFAPSDTVDGPVIRIYRLPAAPAAAHGPFHLPQTDELR